MADMAAGKSYPRSWVRMGPDTFLDDWEPEALQKYLKSLWSTMSLLNILLAAISSLPFITLPERLKGHKSFELEAFILIWGLILVANLFSLGVSVMFLGYTVGTLPAKLQKFLKKLKFLIRLPVGFTGFVVVLNLGAISYTAWITATVSVGIVCTVVSGFLLLLLLLLFIIMQKYWAEAMDDAPDAPQEVPNHDQGSGAGTKGPSP